MHRLRRALLHGKARNFWPIRPIGRRRFHPLTSARSSIPPQGKARSILVDTYRRYVYYVLPVGGAIRYGASPTEDEKRRLGPLPSYVEGGAHNPMGARALYLRRRQGHAVSHPRHEPARVDRTCNFIGLHPADQ